VLVRNRGAAAIASQGATSQPGHLGRYSGLIDEDQAVGVEVRLGCKPRPAPGGNVGPLFLGCVRYFF